MPFATMQRLVDHWLVQMSNSTCSEVIKLIVYVNCLYRLKQKYKSKKKCKLARKPVWPKLKKKEEDPIIFVCVFPKSTSCFNERAKLISRFRFFLNYFYWNLQFAICKQQKKSKFIYKHLLSSLAAVEFGHWVICNPVCSNILFIFFLFKF